MSIAIAPVLEMIGNYVWPFIRIGALVMVMPVLGGVFVPARVRLMLALALTIVISPVLADSPPLDLVSFPGLMIIMREVLIGVAMGFVVQLTFDAIALGGQVISMSMGLGFALFVDRRHGVSTPVLGQLFLMLGMLLFLSLDGHLTMIRILADSFHILPITGDGLSYMAAGGLAQWAGQVFVVAVKIALPAITALVIVNLAFGVMSRAAPTLNLFAIGFPIAMLLGFVAIFLNMDNFRENVSLSLDAAFMLLPDLLEN
ncbi:MAG: flagellar biosynthetic protein FliR [Proteobacteria bacterium]|nr:flagellar biosynthetic protein FliR [Pseudomonadota bacterium]